MNFILYIKYTEEQDFKYHNSFLETINTKLIQADFLDIDNFSGAELIESAYKALEQSDKCCVIVDIESSIEFPAFYKIIYYLVDNPDKCIVFLQGNHSTIEKILQSQPEIFSKDKKGPEIQNKIRSFFNLEKV